MHPQFSVMYMLPDELLLLDTSTAVMNVIFKGKDSLVVGLFLLYIQLFCSESHCNASQHFVSSFHGGQIKSLWSYEEMKTDPLHIQYKTITISCIKDKFIHMYAHMLTFDTYCTVCMCALLSSLTHTNTHTHIHTSVYLAALFSLSC